MLPQRSALARVIRNALGVRGSLRFGVDDAVILSVGLEQLWDDPLFGEYGQPFISAGGQAAVAAQFSFLQLNCVAGKARIDWIKFSPAPAVMTLRFGITSQLVAGAAVTLATAPDGAVLGTARRTGAITFSQGSQVADPLPAGNLIWSYPVNVINLETTIFPVRVALLQGDSFTVSPAPVNEQLNIIVGGVVYPNWPE